MRKKFFLIDIKHPENTMVMTAQPLSVYLWGKPLKNFIILSKKEREVVDIRPAKGDIDKIREILVYFGDQDSLLRKECIRLIKTKSMVHAVKLYREQKPGSSLKEAVDYVNTLRQNPNTV